MRAAHVVTAFDSFKTILIMRKLLLAFATATVLAGCSDDDPAGPQPNPSIALSASTATPSVNAGGAPATVSLTVTRSAGLNDPVTFAVEGLPTGVTASFSPQPLPAGTSTAQMLITAIAAVPAGNTPITVRANGSSVQSAPVQMVLSVVAPAVSGVSFALTPDSLSVRQGQTGTARVRVSRTGGSTGALTLGVVSLPAGITATFAPASPVAGDSTIISVNVASTVAAGTYPLAIRGAATGQADSTKTLRVTVVATGSISIASTPAALTIAPGDSSTTTLVIQRTAPFAGAVTFSLDTTNASGITARFAPASLAAGSDSARVTIVTAASADTGVRTVRILASGAGVAQASASIALTVRRPASFSFTTSMDSITTAQGTNVSTQLNITRAGGYSGAVTFAVDSLPAGVATSFTPASPVAGNSTTLAFVVSASAAPGSYSLPIRATGTGVAAQSGRVLLRITPSGSIALTIGSASLSTTAGDTIRTTVRVVRTAPFADVVRLALDSAPPAGVQASFSSDSLLAGQDSAQLIIVTSDTLAASSVRLTVRATGAGVVSTSATTTVAVAARSGFSLSATPTVLTVQQGRSGQVAVNVGRMAGFTGPVSLVVTGAPQPVTVQITNPTLTGAATSTDMQLIVGFATPVGQYTLTLTGTSPGETAKTVTLTLNVVAP